MADEQLTPVTPDPKSMKKLGVFTQEARINPDRLNDELKAALGEKLVSIETGVIRKNIAVDAEGKPALDDNGNPVVVQEGPFIHVIVRGDAAEADLATVDQLIKDHDPEKLSAVQQRQKDSIDAYARLNAADIAAIRKLIPASSEGEVTREEFEGLKAQVATLLDLMEDWQRLMVAARG